MRLVTYVSERGPRAGLISGSNAFDAWDALGLPDGDRGATVRRLIATPQWMPGKIFDGAAPCGPELVTPDQAGAHDAIEFRLTLNGEQMQASSTADLVFSIPALLAALSRLTTLEPGDIVSTGTPAGVGSVRKPRVWLQDGDALVVSSPTLGDLATNVARSG